MRMLNARVSALRGLASPQNLRRARGKMRRLIALAFGLVVALASSVTSASAESFEDPQGNFNWKVYDYNPSHQALRVRQPFFVREPDGAIAFNFLYEPDTALFMTGHPS